MAWISRIRIPLGAGGALMFYVLVIGPFPGASFSGVAAFITIFKKMKSCSGSIIF